MSCFGDIQFERNWGERIPEDTEEEKRAKQIAKMKEEEDKKTEVDPKKGKKGSKDAKEEEVKKDAPNDEEAKKNEDMQKLLQPKKPIKVLLSETSIHDLLLALEKMEEYDRMMCDLEVANINFEFEDTLLEKLGTPYKR